MSAKNFNKLFIVGLPRTGTTSVCAALLEQGFRVAHTAFSQAAFEQADVVADAPVFCDYTFLDTLYPGSKFIYLHRNLDVWAPSVCQLLERIRVRHQNKPTAFSPVLLRAYSSVFGNEFLSGNVSLESLALHYTNHKQDVLNYFSGRACDFLEVSLGGSDVSEAFDRFLGIKLDVPHLNGNGKISDWSKIKDAKKVDPNLKGKNGRRYFSLLES